MLLPQEKEKIIKEYQLHEHDTGSTPVQIAILTEEIKRLVSHLKEHPKDFHSKRGLLKMVAKRRKLLRYLKRESPEEYLKMIEKLKLKKKKSKK